jgi:recombination protein RecR
MQYSSAVVETLVEELSKLPGIGRKSAQRLAFHLMRAPAGEAMRLSDAIRAASENLGACRRCGNLTEGEICAICADPRRDVRTVCVVEEPMDMVAIERTGAYRGVYHVLRGVLSPLDGIGPDDLSTEPLLQRVREAGGEVEVIVATNPTAQGEATAHYLADLLRPLGARVTRIARGVPVGSDIELSDQVTVAKALEGRKEL